MAKPAGLLEVNCGSPVVVWSKCGSPNWLKDCCVPVPVVNTTLL